MIIETTQTVRHYLEDKWFQIVEMPIKWIDDIRTLYKRITKEYVKFVNFWNMNKFSLFYNSLSLLLMLMSNYNDEYENWYLIEHLDIMYSERIKWLLQARWQQVIICKYWCTKEEEEFLDKVILIYSRYGFKVKIISSLYDMLTMTKYYKNVLFKKI